MTLRTALQWVGYGVFAYFILMQAYILTLNMISAWALRRNHHLNRFGRVTEMLSSRTTPPVTIVIPAFNEEVGIVDAVRSMSLLKYPRFEIVVVNDGSKDGTLQALIDAFRLEKVALPYRPDIETKPVRGLYRGRGAVDITVIDKENGGRADALNAGLNAARYPYVLCTDADVIFEGDALMRAMARVVEDRERTVAVGGNIRPINESEVALGHLIEATVPRRLIPRMQVLEYVRTFLGVRPAWSAINGLPLISGAFGVWRRSIAVAVGGFTPGHFGEDMDMTMKFHRHCRAQGIPNRIMYEPTAVAWTEVPETRRVLRRPRIRGHRGLIQVVREFLPLAFRPRYGVLGMVTWPAIVAFEFLAPIVEFIGWIVIPVAWAIGWLAWEPFLWLLVLAFGMGLLNSLVSLLLDEAHGYFDSKRDTARLLVMAAIENLGFRQLTVWWRIRAMLGGEATKTWGNMERQGFATKTATAPPAPPASSASRP
jgi:cellulose synthase/poly-beta-1,6-N-acetylglucosamine synthase-like glycosyltransferase